MQIGFATRALRSYCLEPTGDQLSESELEKLKARLADIVAAPNLNELVIGRPQAVPELVAFPISIGPAARLDCRIDHVPIRRLPDGRVDLERTDRIKIDSISKTEGQP